mmetsp:Transcript_4903/g.19970  ORF Transcript_4903/g.19970 Transcript_4903/m.19970 type:complete len:302 (-) Transcript_4903:1203-2108(-)
MLEPLPEPRLHVHLALRHLERAPREYLEALPPLLERRARALLRRDESRPRLLRLRPRPSRHEVLAGDERGLFCLGAHPLRQRDGPGVRDGGPHRRLARQKLLVRDVDVPRLREVVKPVLGDWLSRRARVIRVKAPRVHRPGRRHLLAQPARSLLHRGVYRREVLADDGHRQGDDEDAAEHGRGREDLAGDGARIRVAVSDGGHGDDGPPYGVRDGLERGLLGDPLAHVRVRSVREPGREHGELVALVDAVEEGRDKLHGFLGARVRAVPAHRSHPLELGQVVAAPLRVVQHRAEDDERHGE